MSFWGAKRRENLPEGNPRNFTRCPFPAMRRALHFWNRIIAGDNAHSFVCVRLFPTGTKVSRGVPVFSLAMTEYFVRKRKSFACLQKMAWLTYAFYFTPCNALYLSLRLSQSMSDISSRTMQRNFKRHSVSDTVRSRVSIVATDRARFVSSMTLSRESSIRQFMPDRRTLCFLPRKYKYLAWVLWKGFPSARRALHFWNRIIASDNAHSFVCVRLFPTGTKYPAGTPDLSMPRNDIECVARHKLHFWPNNRRKRQLFVFCLFIPFPHGYKVSRGDPWFVNASQWHNVRCT